MLATRVLALGVVIGITVRGDRADEVHEALSRLWTLCPAPDDAPVAAVVEAVLDRDPAVTRAAHDAGVASRPHLDDLLQLLTREVTVAAIDATAGRHVLLHAACLADPGTGRATAFVAPGGTGKTTLARALGPGRWYVTDETVAVAADGSVVPYPKPLSVRRGPTGDHKDEVSPVDLGLRPPAGPVRLSALHLLERVDGHRGPPVATPLRTLDAIEALVPHTSHLVDLDRPLGRLADLVDALDGQPGASRLRYAEATDLAAVLDAGT